MKISKIIVFLCLITIFLNAQVVFTDDYDNSGDMGWNCSNAIRSGYTSLASCDSSTYNNITHYAGEISTGGRSGNSLKLWRRNGIWTEYYGYLNKDFTSDEFNNHYKELYIRWYIKIPDEWDANLNNGRTHKLQRAFIGSTQGSKTKQWYLDVKGKTFKTGKFSFYNTGGGGVLYSKSTISELGVNDGNWHSLEWRLKLNSEAGVADGIIQIFIDGDVISICEGENCSTSITKDFGIADNEFFTSVVPPAIGNLTDGTWNFPTNGWYAIEFDDYIVSTERIGLADIVLFEDWENNNFDNWNYDWIDGATIETEPVYEGNYAVQQTSTNPGNPVAVFGDHPETGLSDSMVSDVSVQSYIYPNLNFQWPSGDMKLWIMNCFESWDADYNTANGHLKPHTWAPYYMTISVNDKGEPFGQLTRSDGLGETGVLWKNYWQNKGSVLSISPGKWNKLKFRLKLNELDKNNGIFQMWLNDTLICEYLNMNYRSSYDKFGWNHLMMSIDPNPIHPQEQWISRDNILILSNSVLPTTLNDHPVKPSGLMIKK